MTRPTIAELEHILAGGDVPRIEILPNGEIRAISDWMAMGSAPQNRKIIAGYFNGCGKWRTVMACYYLPKTLEWNSDYDGGDEDGYAPEGWYEEIENSETIFPMQKPDYWRPLPEPPVLSDEARAALLG